MKYKPRTDTWRDYTLKPFVFPEGFILIQDTREQRPLFQSGRLPAGLTVQSKALKDGDYSVAGYENKFAIERKGMSDLYSYVAAEREKTIKKLERLSQYEFRGLVIDCKESEILRPQEFTRVSPEVVRQALVSFEIRYGMHIYYAGDRDHAARWLLDRAIKYFNIKREA